MELFTRAVNFKPLLLNDDPTHWQSLKNKCRDNLSHDGWILKRIYGQPRVNLTDAKEKMPQGSFPFDAWAMIKYWLNY